MTSAVPRLAAPLRAVRRSTPAFGDDAAPLGVLGYGWPGDAAGTVDAIPGLLLAPAQPCCDAWLGDGATPRTGRTGQIRWREDGRWLYGAAEFDESTGSADLAERTRRIYADLFATLDETGYPHLLRLWNYLPAINADGDGGLERYRHFNVGRQQAFVDAGRTVLEGAPAACALGAPAGPYRLRFLAARRPPVAVENPRQVSAYRYPAQYGPRSPTFSRAALADAGAGRVALFVSGTASIVGHETRHPGDVAAQTRETLANLQALTDAAGAHGSAVFGLRDLQAVVYVRHAADWPTVRDIVAPVLGPDLVALQADVCRSELLVEIEAHAFADGRLAAVHAEPGACS